MLSSIQYSIKLMDLIICINILDELKRRLPMEFRTIETFLKIVETNSFTKAANDLGYAQSTVTTQIKQLESELDTLLFDRVGTKILLTESGERFKEYAYHLQSLAKQAKDIVAADDFPSGQLRIGTVDSFAASVLPDLTKTYTSSYPQVKLSITLATSTEIELMLKHGLIDIAIYFGLTPCDDPSLVLINSKKPLRIVCGQSHSMAKKKTVSLLDLSKEQLILTEKECQYHKATMALFKNENLSPSILLEAGNTEIIKKFVSKGLGIAILPELTVQEELVEQTLISIKSDFTLPPVYIQLAFHGKKYKSKAMDAFLEMTSSLL